ncbi:hypothetical protein XM38_016120 [Halomicronema hongdechloris C2206]|uniref:Uncharacterized protein n=1 Tax=Halomicronema hongdechloris C2206 TaxID=1641165 RepID=A0A1Z3HKP7_9CYAN|nr:hypothetical protein XM38_016120 [Halomicronema hongdechloris C2206]
MGELAQMGANCPKSSLGIAAFLRQYSRLDLGKVYFGGVYALSADSS